MKCFARISGASADWEGSIPKAVLAWSKKWSENQSEDVGKSILNLMGNHLKASFLPVSLPELSQYLESTEDINADEVLPFAFDFEDDGSPVVGAYAVFEVPFKKNVNAEFIEQWSNDEGDSMAWCVSFFWEFEGREIYLDIDFDSVTFSAAD